MGQGCFLVFFVGIWHIFNLEICLLKYFWIFKLKINVLVEFEGYKKKLCNNPIQYLLFFLFRQKFAI